MRGAALLLLFLAAPLGAAGPNELPKPAIPSAPTPGEVLTRYIATTSQSPDWGAESVEIDASIPALSKRGHLTAIRRTPAPSLPAGKPEYEVLALEGDRTVRQQVIARYLSAEVEAARLPPASVAIAPENYRFRYAGSVAFGEIHAYVFEITPHKKRAGLLHGQLWIDAGTGLALRLTGYFVKRPSVFVKRIEITRNTSIRDGAAYARTTHVEIDTRLIGRAELTITERPYVHSGSEPPRSGD